MADDLAVQLREMRCDERNDISVEKNIARFNSALAAIGAAAEQARREHAAARRRK